MSLEIMSLEIIPSVISTILSILKTWWWVFLPCVLYFPCKELYFSWIRWEIWYKKQEWTMLEIIPPSEIEKPFIAMEYLFASLWTIYNSPNWRGKWCQGVLPIGASWFSFEILSDAGEIHFYLRSPKDYQRYVETAIHAHYPDAEIFEVDDYIKNIPQDIPNDRYDLKGEDYMLKKENYKPIKTYKFFEAKAPEAVIGEKKVDPIHSLMEAMAKLKKGEQFWFQLVAAPITNQDIPWIDEGKKAVDELAKRSKKGSSEKSIIQEVIDILIFNIFSSEEKKEEKKEVAVFTPGEEVFLKAVEEKMTKNAFKVHMRALYIYEKQAYNAEHSKIIRNYFVNFGTENLNSIGSLSKTKPSIEYFFKKRREYKRKKAIFEKYTKRFPPLYPQMIGEGNTIFNIEELASIFHFPTKAAVLPPSVPRVISRKAPPPPGIPME